MTHLLDDIKWLIELAWKQSASDIYVQSQLLEGVIYLKKSHQMIYIGTISKPTIMCWMRHLLIISNLSLNQTTYPMELMIQHHGRRLRVVISMTIHGIYIHMRPLIDVLSLENILTQQPQLSLIQQFQALKEGHIIIYGQSGQGKTTLLHAILNDLSKNTHNILTYENPIEIINEALCQIEFDAPSNIHHLIKVALRQNFDSIALGELRDQHSELIFTKLINSGHLFLTTCHAQDLISLKYTLKAVCSYLSKPNLFIQVHEKKIIRLDIEHV